MNFASAGIGAASHLAAEKFNVAAGIKAQHVPFKGPVEALTEVMAGRIDYYFLPIAPALALIKDGKVTALAVSSNKRAPSLPDVPTTAEIGYAARRPMRSGMACSFRRRRPTISSRGSMTRPRRRWPMQASGNGWRSSASSLW